MFSRINRVLPELLIGIVLYGLALQVCGVWFASDKLRYSTGVWIGILLACAMSIHLAIVIEDAVSLGKSARTLAAKSVGRYLIVAVVLFVMMYFQLGNIFAAFAGILGMKVSAYLQPYTHKLVLWIMKKVNRNSK
ncbi:MAG: hypothetical protein ACK5ML_07250 [Lachnospiraceae bacterium]